VNADPMQGRAHHEWVATQRRWILLWKMIYAFSKNSLAHYTGAVYAIIMLIKYMVQFSTRNSILRIYGQM